MLQIKDRPGVISSEDMRKHFEKAIQRTSVLAKNTPLGHITVNGAFSHYADANTDTMWIGFALGMRGMEQLNRRRQDSDA